METCRDDQVLMEHSGASTGFTPLFHPENQRAGGDLTVTLFGLYGTRTLCVLWVTLWVLMVPRRPLAPYRDGAVLLGSFLISSTPPSPERFGVPPQPSSLQDTGVPQCHSP